MSKPKHYNCHFWSNLELEFNSWTFTWNSKFSKSLKSHATKTQSYQLCSRQVFTQLVRRSFLVVLTKCRQHRHNERPWWDGSRCIEWNHEVAGWIDVSWRVQHSVVVWTTHRHALYQTWLYTGVLSLLYSVWSFLYTVQYTVWITTTKALTWRGSQTNNSPGNGLARVGQLQTDGASEPITERSTGYGRDHRASQSDSKQLWLVHQSVGSVDQPRH